MKIKNFPDLAKNEFRKKALEIVEAGLASIDTRKIIKENVRIENDELVIRKERLFLKDLKRIFVVGIGKCSLEAAAALEENLKDRIDGGIVVDVRDGTSLRKINFYQGDHPFPSEKNVEAAKQIIELLDKAEKNDLVIMIVSGGGSTLLCQPRNFTPRQESKVVKCLFGAGATIQEINTVRKHLSLARGGNLAKYAYPARVISLIFSDVPGNDPEIIASGPTVKDTTTKKDAEKIMEKYKLESECGLNRDALMETPKDEKYFEKVDNIILVSNKIALEAMAQKAKESGWNPKIITDRLSGEAENAGRDMVKNLDAAEPKEIFFYGGETTVTVAGLGKGGRNLTLALSALRFMKKDEMIIAVASDGYDNTDFAGAVCDAITKEKAEKMKLDAEKHLKENDSYRFFEQTGDYILTGYTGSNVSDLILAIKN